MTSDQHKTVTVLTPVYNGAAYLSECMESVLAQTYDDWEYIVVNNKSTDATLEIANSYAARDPRIKVVTNDTFLSMPGNFNRAFTLVPSRSKYVKVVCADDWILPNCLSEMVSFAERHPTAGIIVCYQQSGSNTRWKELPTTIEVLDGRLAARMALLEGKQILGAPTAHLYRAEVLRGAKSFFPNEAPHSDTCACLEKLDQIDFGIVHQVLSVERVHAEQISSKISDVAAADLAYLEVVNEYGRKYLTEAEFAGRSREVYDSYCRGLGRAALKLRGRGFWDYQRRGLAKLGLVLDYKLITMGAVAAALRHTTRPFVAATKVGAAIQHKFSR